MAKKLMLVDGHSLAYRAYHALPPEMATSAGEPTNAVYGFTTMLLTMLEAEHPDYVIVTFDKGPSFRVRKYAGYKAHRAKMPGEMRGQMERIYELVEALGFPRVELADYEADDLLGTLSRQAEEQGVDVVIVTGDRDALQLVDDHVTVLTSGRRFSDTLRYTPEKVQAKYGLVPQQLVDLKALMGDTSDAIPGVRGVGQKGGAKLLRQYGSLDALYEHLEELPTRYRNALGANREMAYLSQELGRIVRSAPVQLDLESAAYGKHINRQALLDLLRELEFTSLLPRINSLFPDATAGQLPLFADLPADTPAAPPGTYHLVADAASLAELAQQLAQASLLTLDTETTSTDALRAELVGISLTDRAAEAWYVPLRAPQGEPTLPLATVQQHLGPLLADADIAKQGHNLKYDLKILARHGLPVRGELRDTMIAAWLRDPATRALGLKSLAQTRLGIQMTEITSLIGKGRTQQTMDTVPLAQVVPYAGADADLTHRLAEILLPELAEREQLALFRELEMPLLPILAEMELAGIKLDVSRLAAFSAELETRLAELRGEVYRLADGEFNLNSTQQLSDVLFKRLGLPSRGIGKTKSGHYSTRAEVLERLRDAHPIVPLILQYRELSKLKSTYVDSLPQLINPATGRVHTVYHQTGTVTGRLSSSDPNLQNIPIRTQEGRRVRMAFVAERGWVLLSADYSQVELRVMAHVSRDPGLIAAFQSGEDVHATTAAAIYGVPLAEVSYEMRRVAKAVNFGLIYGQGAYGLARQIGVSPPEAEEFIRRYFERFPRVHAYMQQVQDEAATKGYVETLLHRRRYFPELTPQSRAPKSRRQAAQRMAINTPIQGTAADILKLAMLRVRRQLREQGLRTRMLLQVHDEVVCEVPQEELTAATSLIRRAMESAFALCVPLKVDVEIGENWGEMEELP